MSRACVRLPSIVLAEEHRERAGFELHVLDGPMSVEMQAEQADDPRRYAPLKEAATVDPLLNYGDEARD
jgi:hypothetical protein